jgi:hypothetical protein
MEELCLNGVGTVLRHGTEVLDLFNSGSIEAEQHRLNPENMSLLRGLLNVDQVRGLKITQGFGSEPHFKLRVCFNRNASLEHLVTAFREIVSVVHHHMPDLVGT